jgi:hypothetical protein
MEFAIALPAKKWQKKAVAQDKFLLFQPLAPLQSANSSFGVSP